MHFLPRPACIIHLVQDEIHEWRVVLREPPSCPLHGVTHRTSSSVAQTNMHLAWISSSEEERENTWKAHFPRCGTKVLHILCSTLLDGIESSVNLAPESLCWSVYSASLDLMYQWTLSDSPSSLTCTASSQRLGWWHKLWRCLSLCMMRAIDFLHYS